jgi:RES domain-containing protein
LPLDVDPVPVRGVWYRHVPHRGRVWWRADPPPSGRWQRGSVVGGFYLADSPETAWAEWHRLLAELGLRPEQQLPRNLWRLAVDLERIANLSDADRLAAAGLPLPAPTRGQWPAFQAVGGQLHAEGWAGVLAPSAARRDAGAILCVFRGEETIDGVTPIPPPAIYRHPPALPGES